MLSRVMPIWLECDDGVVVAAFGQGRGIEADENVVPDVRLDQDLWRDRSRCAGAQQKRQASTADQEPPRPHQHRWLTLSAEGRRGRHPGPLRRLLGKALRGGVTMALLVAITATLLVLLVSVVSLAGSAS